MLQAKKTVSIIVPCYNYAKYIASCLESILVQTYCYYEIIIVNDGSTDDTEDVVKGFLSDPRIRYIRKENGGQASAKNTGIRAATGDFLAFLDADDLWENTKLEKQMPLFSDPEVGVVYSRARFIDENGRSLKYRVEGQYLTPRFGKVTQYLFFDNFIPFSSSVVRRECLERAGPFDESLRMGIDWDLWLRISVDYTFAYVDEPLLVYRMGHSGQMSRNLAERQRCSDRITRKFLKAHADAIPKSVIRNALAYTYCSRAYYNEAHNQLHAIKLYTKALLYKPYDIRILIYILRCLTKHLIYY